MAKVIVHTNKTNLDGNNMISFHCPGCGERHAINYDDKHHWAWNGDEDKPTINPSILRRSGHYMPEHKGPCWCDYSRYHPGEETPFKCGVCHLFVRDGKIQFLSDCTHELVGQTVDMLEEE